MRLWCIEEKINDTREVEYPSQQLVLHVGAVRADAPPLAGNSLSLYASGSTVHNTNARQYSTVTEQLKKVNMSSGLVPDGLRSLHSLTLA